MNAAAGVDRLTCSPGVMVFTPETRHPPEQDIDSGGPGRSSTPLVAEREAVMMMPVVLLYGWWVLACPLGIEIALMSCGAGDAPLANSRDVASCCPWSAGAHNEFATGRTDAHAPLAPAPGRCQRACHR